MQGEAQRSAADEAAKKKAAAYLGQVLGGRYRVESVLALGGMGAVFRAWHVHMRKHVALKLLHPTTENLPELVARFERESIVNAHLTHPNVCSAMDFGRFEDGSHYLVLDYVEGRTLRDVMREGPIAPARAAEIARQIADALGAAHELQIVHRDVKPSNVMLADGPRVHVMIVDFGLAKLPSRFLTTGGGDDVRVTRSGTVFGTVAYMAPELAGGMHLVDHRSDLYALGIVLYEMLAGKHPFDAIEPAELFRQHRNQAVPAIAARAPGVEVPRALEAIARRLLEKKPDARFQDADELLDALDAIYPPEAIPASRPSQRSNPSVRLGALAPRSRRGLETHDPSDASPPPAPALEPAEKPKGGGWLTKVIVAVAVLLVGVGGVRRFAPEVWDRLGLEPPRDGSRGASAATAGATGAAAPTPSAEASAEASASESSSPSASAAPSAPPSPEVLRLRGVLHEAASEHDAKRGARALLDLGAASPDAFRSADIVASAAAIAVAVETGDRSMADDVFGLFSGPALGPGGPDVLFHVVCFSGGSRAATRAADLLAKPEVIAHASPGLRIARELRNAPCKDRPALYDRAVADGDDRALTLLAEMRGASCLDTPGACCAPSDLKLADAIAKLRERLRK